MKCPKCGSELPEHSKFCLECGYDISSSGSQADSESDLDAAPTMPDHATLSDEESGPSGSLIAGRYEILELRGEGGMGRVYRARDTKLGIDVAIKRLSMDLKESELGVRRFLNEAQTVARLNHQNIVHVNDIDEDEQGHYIVMEWVEGSDLAELVRTKGKLELEEALRLFNSICSGVSYAHRHSVIHRDIKPQNILITRDGVPKLVDFGLARIGRESDLSRSGYGLGTMSYMPPEQRRDAKRADHRSDIFSLAKTFYFMVTGDVPDTIDPDVLPEPIRASVMRALKPKPEDRYFSVDGFWDVLEKSAGGARAGGGASSSEAPATARPRFTKKAALIGVVCVLVACGSLAAGLVHTAGSHRSHLEQSRSLMLGGDLVAALDGLEFSEGFGVDGTELSGLRHDIGTLLLDRGQRAEGRSDYLAAAETLRLAASRVPEVAGEARRRLEALEAEAAPRNERVASEIELARGAEEYYKAWSLCDSVIVLSDAQDSEVEALREEIRGSLDRAIVGLLGEESYGSLDRADSGISVMERMKAPEARVLEQRAAAADVRERLDEARLAREEVARLQAKRQRDRELRVAHVDQLVASIEKAIERPGQESAEQAEADLRRLKEMDAADSRIPELESGMERVRSLLGPPPVGSYTGEENTFEIYPGVEMAFVWVPPGSFRMGSSDDEPGRGSDERPQHSVAIGEGFWLGKYEVTRGEWKSVMGSNPSRFRGNNRRPVEQVSWDGIQPFLRKINGIGGSGYRLPSEAEWEYACRAGTSTPYSSRHGDSHLGTYAWYSGNSASTTHPVGQKNPNAWGLHDMHGNVYEWCSDAYHSSYAGAPADGSSWEDSPRAKARVLRGGSWFCFARHCRSAARHCYSPGTRCDSNGFRLARSR